MLLYLRDGSAQTTACAATLRQRLQIKLATSPSHSILTLGHSVLTLILQHQKPGNVATRAPVFKPLVSSSHLSDGNSSLLDEGGSTSQVPPSYCRACRLRECGLARFLFRVACRGGRTAAYALLFDCKYCKGTALYG